MAKVHSSVASSNGRSAASLSERRAIDEVDDLLMRRGHHAPDILDPHSPGTLSFNGGAPLYLVPEHDRAPAELGASAAAAGKSETKGPKKSPPSPSPEPEPVPAPSPAPSPSWRELAPPEGDSTAPSDSYFGSQWALTSARGGINVLGAWQNYTGAGVKIGIVDNGFDYAHADLSPRYRSDLDYDARDRDGDAYCSDVNDIHGTTVAGVAAGARDGSGIVGVAYNADWAGIRIGYGSAGSSSQYADALSHALPFDVVNCSWGYSTPFQDNFRSYWSSSAYAIENAVANGRGGLGTSIVFAAMNNRAAGDNVNYHNYQNSPYVITVGATDAYGKVASFSNPGAALLVAAGGNGIVTDDRSGSSGWSSGDYVTASGTSYAAPAVSGVIALMLQANPDLGYRDVQQILAYSAKQTDPLSAGWAINGAHDWNGGGLHFSHDYGFGLVDATAAVRLAESWQVQSTYANLATMSVASGASAAIPDGGALTSRLSFGASMTLDKIVLDLSLTHYSVRELTVTLTSPNGTTAVLVDHAANGTGSGINFTFSANDFWGENTLGTWTLSIADAALGNVGTLNSWTLKALGDATTADDVYVYTNEYGALADASRGVLHDSGGTDTINLAAVSTGVSLDLNEGAASSVVGAPLAIASGTSIENAWLGDGDDIVIGNALANIVQGGRGADVITGGGGADTLYGGPGHDMFVYNALADAGDTIKDFRSGEDAVDLVSLFTALGYNGSDAVADQWLSLVASGTGATSFILDPHNGQQSVTLLTIENVTPEALQKGIDYYWLGSALV